MTRNIFFLFLNFFALSSSAQSAFLNRHSDGYFLFDRYDILNARVSDTLITSLQPLSQKDAIAFLEQYTRTHEASLSATESWGIKKTLSKNGEWTSNGQGAVNSKYPFLKTIYAKQSDLLNIHHADYDIVLNPIIAYQQTFESKNSKQNLFLNTRGLEARGNIGKRLGFYTIFTDNQERGPLHHQQYVSRRSAVPGSTYYKEFKIEKPGLAQDYLYAAGYLDASIVRQKINVSFGSYRFHIGDGYRSLFLSDFGSNYLFLRLNTRLGKFNYQNLFMELTPQYLRGADRLLPKKYAALHHLSINARPWLNIGLFESVVYGRKDRFEFQYLNPMIFYRSVEQSLGSPDNAMLGMNFKINTGIGAVVYGQLLLDEFRFAKIKEMKGWWGNKYAAQLGVKMADPFGVRNLIVQPELNIIRPFTYSYTDSLADFSHYNQSLAHPYGANLMELSLHAYYQPIKKLTLSWHSFYNKQGRDTASTISFGGNIFSSNLNRPSESGIYLFNGYSSSVFYTNMNASYEIRDNLYFDFGLAYRSEEATHPVNPTFNSMMISTGFRLNAARKQYDY